MWESWRRMTVKSMNKATILSHKHWKSPQIRLELTWLPLVQTFNIHLWPLWNTQNWEPLKSLWPSNLLGTCNWMESDFQMLRKLSIRTFLLLIVLNNSICWYRYPQRSSMSTNAPILLQIMRMLIVVILILFLWEFKLIRRSTRSTGGSSSIKFLICIKILITQFKSIQVLEVKWKKLVRWLLIVLTH